VLIEFGGRPIGKLPRSGLSSTEPEACVQPLKNKAIAPSHKVVALANSDRIVVAVGVDSSCETEPLPEMLEQAKRVSSGDIDRLKLDAGFHGGGALKHCAEQEIKVLCPSGPASSNYRKRHSGKFSKAEFRYDGEKDVYICPAGEELRRQYAYAGNKHNKAYIRYGTSACAECPLRSQCTTAKNGRRIKRYDNDHLKLEATEAFLDPANQEAYKRRSAEIEPVFADWKVGFGFRRFRRWGLAGARLDAAIHAFAHNCKRALCIAFSRAKDLPEKTADVSDKSRLAALLWPLVTQRGSRLFPVEPHQHRARAATQPMSPSQITRRSLRASALLAAA